MYNCLSEEQRKYLVEKEQLVNQLKEKEEKFISEKEALESKNKELEDGKFMARNIKVRNNQRVNKAFASSDKSQKH